METTNQQSDVPGWGKRKTYRKIRVKENQLIWIVYEKPNKNGHIITAVDGYRNILGRITEKFDEVQNRFEYTFIDAEGKELFKSDDLEKLKQQVSKNKEILFEKAHNKRLERIQQMKQLRHQQEQQQKPKEKTLKAKEVNPMNPAVREKKYRAWNREQELKQMREQKAQKQERGISR